METGLVNLPIPVTFLEVIWVAVGFSFGRSFGKKIDYQIQNSDWFKKQSWVVRELLVRVLDFLHHWWMGAFLMLYSDRIILLLPFLSRMAYEIYWFGYGMFLDDLPDMPARFRKLFKKVEEEVEEKVVEVKP